MKLEATKLALAAAMATAVLWTICSALVAAMPGSMMGVSGSMVHADFSTMSWSMNMVSFVIGLILWSLMAAVLGWLIATFYNWQTK